MRLAALTDSSIFVIANIINLLIAAIFIARKKGLERREYQLGIIVMCLAVPLFLFALFNFFTHREWWTFILPLPMVLYAMIEYLLDYHLKSDFRSTWLMGPYMLVFYMALFGLIGYAFLVNQSFGYITLFTYFINLLATWYGH